ncbi:MAG: hypothetical protein AAB587_00975 [Patescibacteria group bacterium]
MQFIEGVIDFVIFLIVFPFALIRQLFHAVWEKLADSDRKFVRVLAPIGAPLFFILDVAQDTWDDMVD